MFADEDFLSLSGLQHFLFCRRQWALIHIEQQWAENVLTIGGTLLHERAHNETLRERRWDTLITRNMRIFSRRLGLSGQCDVLEFHRNAHGITLHGEEGLWLPYPVEYKRGQPKEGNFDVAQLAAQAICLEEMLCCEISQGALFYGETKRRMQVIFSPQLRAEVETAVLEMHRLFERRHTPKAKPTRQCASCSLQDLCLPRLTKCQSVSDYLEELL